MAHGYIGAQPATTTDIAVVADISESLDISGFTPHITVSSLPSLAVSSITLVEPMAVSGTVTTAAPANQNVSGISLDAIKVATEAIQTDSAANEVLLTTIDTVLDNIKVDTEAIETATEAIQVDAAAIEVLLTNANTDHAANEVLLTAIDTVLDTIKVDTEAIETATEAIQVDAAAIEVLLTNANTDHAANEVLLTAIDAVLDTIKVDTEAIETAVESSVANAGNVLTLKRNVIAPVTGLDVNIKPSTSSYLSHVYIDLDGAGDNPTSNTEVIAAPGASSKLVIYGVQGSIVGATAAAYGNWFLSDGNTSAATTLWTGRAQGITNTQFELTFPYGVALTTNTALKVTSTEGSGNIFINAVVYYRTEAV
jgi:hypothetical protein